MRIRFRSSPVVRVLVILILFWAILFFMQRPLWCSCGLKLVTLDAWGSESSQNFIDPYTTSHILHGILFFALLVLFFRQWSLHRRLIIALLLEVAWEVFENSSFIIDRYRTATASQGYTGDTILNSTSDVLFMLFGFWLASRLPWKWTLMILVLTEVLMLAVYRANLTLNVLMLIAPDDAVREWQSLR